jgi:hypothetical protein
VSAKNYMKRPAAGRSTTWHCIGTCDEVFARTVTRAVQVQCTVAHLRSVVQTAQQTTKQAEARGAGGHDRAVLLARGVTGAAAF